VARTFAVLLCPCPETEAARIAEVASMVTYGWGVIPVTVSVGATTATTSLFPKDGGYLVPIRDAVRLPEKLSVGDIINVTLAIAV
jgi:hypothetical protein